MNKLITVALLCAPFSLQAAHFNKERVDFDKDGKPLISANLALPPIKQKVETLSSNNTDHIVKTNTSFTKNSLSKGKEGINAKVSHFIYPDESYFDAISRWLKRDNIENLAWAINEEATAALTQSPVGTVSFKGNTLDVVKKLSQQLGVPFYMHLDNYHHRAAIHQWHDRDVQISMVGGSTLKESIRQLTLDYGWNWVEDATAKSWLATSDYSVSIPYPIVTPKGDLRRALQLVLDGYPVSARLLESNHTLFIVDTE